MPTTNNAIWWTLKFGWRPPLAAALGWFTCFVLAHYGFLAAAAGITVAAGVGTFVLILATVYRDSVWYGLYMLAVGELTIIAMFAILYSHLGVLVLPGEEVTVDLGECFYFSIITWTTLGYGKQVPSAEAEWVAAAEALVGSAYMPLVLGLIVGGMQARPRNR